MFFNNSVTEQATTSSKYSDASVIMQECLEDQIAITEAYSNARLAIAGVIESSNEYDIYDEYSSVKEGAIRDFFAKIIEAIKRLIERIRDFFRSLFGKSKSKSEKISDAEKKLNAAMKNPDKAKIVNGSTDDDKKTYSGTVVDNRKKSSDSKSSSRNSDPIDVRYSYSDKKEIAPYRGKRLTPDSDIDVTGYDFTFELDDMRNSIKGLTALANGSRHHVAAIAMAYDQLKDADGTDDESKDIIDEFDRDVSRGAYEKIIDTYNRLKPNPKFNMANGSTFSELNSSIPSREMIIERVCGESGKNVSYSLKELHAIVKNLAKYNDGELLKDIETDLVGSLHALQAKIEEIDRQMSRSLTTKDNNSEISTTSMLSTVKHMASISMNWVSIFVNATNTITHITTLYQNQILAACNKVKVAVGA